MMPLFEKNEYGSNQVEITKWKEKPRPGSQHYDKADII